MGSEALLGRRITAKERLPVQGVNLLRKRVPASFPGSGRQAQLVWWTVRVVYIAGRPPPLLNPILLKSTFEVSPAPNVP